jgi:hypothetical protein
MVVRQAVPRLLLSTLLAVLPSAPVTAAASEATAPTPAALAVADRFPGAPAPPLASFLQPDGTLALPAGFQGNLDVRGWALDQTGGGPPRFVPTGGAPVGSSPAVTAALGDASNWDDRFPLSGVGGQVEALVVSGSDVYLGGVFLAVGPWWSTTLLSTVPLRAPGQPWETGSTIPSTPWR